MQFGLFGYSPRMSISVPLLPFSELYFHFFSSPTILFVKVPSLFLSFHSLCYISISLLSNHSLCYISISLPLLPFSVLYFHLPSSPTILCVIFPSLFLSYHSVLYIHLSSSPTILFVKVPSLFLSYHSLCYISISLPLLPFSM